MNLLTRYLARELYFSIGLVFLALVTLFTFLDLIREMGNMGQGNYSLGYMILFVLLYIPGRIYELAPVATLIGAIFGFVHLASTSEFTIYRTSGMSLQQMIGAVFKIAAPLIVLVFVCGEFIAPPSERMAKEVRLKAQNSQMTLKEFRSGVWLKDENSFVNVRNVSVDGSLSDVNIYHFDKGAKLEKITHAKSAQFMKEGGWQLTDVTETLFTHQRTNVQQHKQQIWNSGLQPNILSVMLVVPEQMSAYDLYQYTNHLIENQQKSTRYRIAMWNKLLQPFSLLVMMLLALPFAAYQRRSGGVSGLVFVGIILGLAYHFASRIVLNLGTLNDWPPFLTAICVTVIFIVLAIFLLLRTEKR